MGEQKASDKPKIWHFNLKVTEGEYERIQKLQERLQVLYGESVRVSQKTVFLEALSALERYYAKLDKDKGRDR